MALTFVGRALLARADKARRPTKTQVDVDDTTRNLNSTAERPTTPTVRTPIILFIWMLDDV